MNNKNMEKEVDGPFFLIFFFSRREQIIQQNKSGKFGTIQQRKKNIRNTKR